MGKPFYTPTSDISLLISCNYCTILLPQHQRKGKVNVMRKGFIGYYKPTQKELEKLWKESIFVFDTSVLLNIYRYSPEAREDFFKLLEELKHRIWIPYQVAFEFHEQRENVITQQDAIYDDIEGIIRFLQKAILDKYRKGHPFANIDQIKGIFEEAVEKAKATLQEAQSKHPNLMEEDIHLTRLTTILENKVGEEFPKEKVNKIYEEGQQRYKDKVPPGYEDAKNKEGTKPYGDLLLWYQLIEHAKARKKPIIFITDDTKEDWWRQGREKILGPRPELIQEIYDKANVAFYMYLADEFIKRAQEFLNVQIQPGTIEETREIRQSQDDLEERINQEVLVRRLLEEIGSSSTSLEIEKIIPFYFSHHHFTDDSPFLYTNLSRLLKYWSHHHISEEQKNEDQITQSDKIVYEKDENNTEPDNRA